MKNSRGLSFNPLSGNTVGVLALAVLFLLGGLVGCLLAAQVQGEGGAALRQYLQDYLTVAGSESVRPGIWSVIWAQARFPLLIVVLSFTAVGLAGIPVIFFIRGFLFAFSVSCVFRSFGEAGLLPALFLFGLPALLWAPALFLLGVLSLRSSYDMLRRTLGDSPRPSCLQGEYWMCCGLCAGIMALCAAFEYFALPALVGASASAVL